MKIRKGPEILSPLIEPSFMHADDLRFRRPFDEAMDLLKRQTEQREAMVARTIITIMLALHVDRVEIRIADLVNVPNYEIKLTPDPKTGGQTLELRKRT